ncbi:hypothetical protein ASE91_14290 [Sphingomonas sp. Leaf62]|nr:hypothetical protein ASE91_14290 [Sphingomonas sp. Leaf62]
MARPDNRVGVILLRVVNGNYTAVATGDFQEAPYFSLWAVDTPGQGLVTYIVRVTNNSPKNQSIATPTVTISELKR